MIQDSFSSSSHRAFQRLKNHMIFIQFYHMVLLLPTLVNVTSRIERESYAAKLYLARSLPVPSGTIPMGGYCCHFICNSNVMHDLDCKAGTEMRNSVDFRICG